MRSAPRSNYFRFRLSPEVVISAGARVKQPGEEMKGEAGRASGARHHPQREKSPYERLLGDAICGDNSLFTSDECVEAAWAVVDQLLTHKDTVSIYEPGTWGPAAAAQIVTGREGWHDPKPEASSPCRVTPLSPLFPLLDVDNTLLDNDRFTTDLSAHLEESFGHTQRERYWAIYDELRDQLGYGDYLGALQLFRHGLDNDPALLQMSPYLLEYPFVERLYPHAFETIKHLHTIGRPVILSDGDVVFQPRKIQHSWLVGPRFTATYWFICTSNANSPPFKIAIQPHTM